MSQSRRSAYALAVIACLFLLTGCQGGTMTSYRLQQSAESLQSLAADGQLLAQGVADDETTGAFVRVHSSELAIRSRDLASELESARWLPQTREKTPELIDLARTVAENLERLHDRASNPTVGADVEKQLGDLGDEAETLGKNA
jgi:hypothetical protein